MVVDLVGVCRECGRNSEALGDMRHAYEKAAAERDALLQATLDLVKYSSPPYTGCRSEEIDNVMRYSQIVNDIHTIVAGLTSDEKRVPK